MAESKDRNDPRDTSPEAHWYPIDEQGALTPREAILSPVQAVIGALSSLGRSATTAEVRQYLGGRGIQLDDARIDQVRKELTHESQ